jgi:hypothetical protein
LLTLEWANGPLPSDHKKLAQAVGISGHNWKRDWDRIWNNISSKFSQISLINLSKISQKSLIFLSHLSQHDPSLLVNIRLEITRGKQLNNSKLKKKAAMDRWSKNNAGAMQAHKQTVCSPSSSPSPIKNKKNIIREIPPKLEDVKSYCSERNNGINPEQFFDYYESRGWMIGKNKMKDFRAAIRTWERNNKDNPVQTQDTNSELAEYFKKIGGNNV